MKERKLQGDTGSTRSLSYRGDGFGRQGVISFVVDTVAVVVTAAVVAVVLILLMSFFC